MATTDPNQHPVFVYELRPRSVPPELPASAGPDPHAETPFAASFAARRAAFLDCVRRTPPPAHLCAVFHEVARLAAGGPAHVPLFEAALDYVDARLDCADFVLHGILRLLFHFGDDPRLPRALVERAHASVRGFKYWPDEPGADSLCSWTENHEILFASAAMLAGRLHPDALFPNSGAKGREVAAAGRRRVSRWLELRFRTGFSEWLSHVYYDEDLLALLALVDFAGDPEIEARAAMVADLLLLDMALHHYRGVFASSHGRSYERCKIAAREEGTTDLAKLAFGVGSFARVENQSAVALALSPRYRVPAAIVAIANDRRDAVTIRQRMGIRLDELSRWNLDPCDPEDMMVLLSLEAYAHPRTIAGFVALLDRFGWWSNAFFAPFARQRTLLTRLRRARLLPLVARVVSVGHEPQRPRRSRSRHLPHARLPAEFGAGLEPRPRRRSAPHLAGDARSRRGVLHDASGAAERALARLVDGIGDVAARGADRERAGRDLPDPAPPRALRAESQSLHARLAAARSLRRGERVQRLVLRAPRRRLSGAALAAAGVVGRSERGARCRA